MGLSAESIHGTFLPAPHDTSELPAQQRPSQRSSGPLPGANISSRAGTWEVLRIEARAFIEIRTSNPCYQASYIPWEFDRIWEIVGIKVSHGVGGQYGGPPVG